jgi:hypothetical protein
MAHEEEGAVKAAAATTPLEDPKKAPRAAEPTIDFLDETQQRAAAAYVAYVEAERQLERAYKEQEAKAEKAYADSLERARKENEEAVAAARRSLETSQGQARKVMEDGLAKARQAYEDSASQLRKAFDDSTVQAKKEFDAAVAAAMSARAEVENKARVTHGQAMAHTWTVFTKARR